MTYVDALKEKEVEDWRRVEVEAEEVPLEELIILGNNKKIPIHIIFPHEDGSKTKSKALVKQLTLKELDRLNFNGNNLGSVHMKILQKAFFKSTGDRFSRSELEEIPVGVVKAVSDKILELSGMDPQGNSLGDF